MKTRRLLAACVALAALFAFAGCDSLPLFGTGSLFGGIGESKGPDPFEPDGLEAVRPYILETPNYTVTNCAMGAKLAITTYVTDTCILVNSFDRYDYYVTVGDRLYSFWRMKVGATTDPEIETEETRSSLTRTFTGLFRMDWVWDEASQSYLSEDCRLTIEETSVMVDLGFYNYLFEDIGRTTISVPHVIYR